MMGGCIVVLGDLGRDAGESIIRGVIYVLGEVESLGKNAKLVGVNENDKKEIKSILNSYFNLNNSEYDNFRKIIPKSKRPFYGK
jgi:glutamate synthase domain-containing protein 3